MAGSGKRLEEGFLGGGLGDKERVKECNSQSVKSNERALRRINSVAGQCKWGKRPHPTRFESRSSSLRRLARDAEMSGKPPSAPGTEPVLSSPLGRGRNKESLPASVLCAVWRGVWAAPDSAFPGTHRDRLPRQLPCLGRLGWCTKISSRERSHAPRTGGKPVPGPF